MYETRSRRTLRLSGEVRDPDTVVQTIGDLPLTVKDLDCGGPGRWFNDQLINAYFWLLAKKSQKFRIHRTIHAFATFFLSNLLKSSFQDMRRWTKRVVLYSLSMSRTPADLSQVGRYLCF